MSRILPPDYNLPPIYEVKVSLKNREELRGFCRGTPDPGTFGEWLYLAVEMPYKSHILVKTEEIAYINYRPRREKE